METNQEHLLDLRGVACPLNFVKTRLYLDKMDSGGVVIVLLDPGEPVESVSKSIQEEGHRLIGSSVQPEGYYRVTIVKV